MVVAGTSSQNKVTVCFAIRSLRMCHALNGQTYPGLVDTGGLHELHQLFIRYRQTLDRNEVSHELDYCTTRLFTATNFVVPAHTTFACRKRLHGFASRRSFSWSVAVDGALYN